MQQKGVMIMKCISRNKQHNVAMSIIYQILCLQDLKIDYDIKELIASALDEPFEDVDIYIKQVVVGAIAHQHDIIVAYTPFLVKWKFERLAKVEQAILFLAYSHYYFVKDVDKKVVISIAVNQAKDYLNKDDYKFVNAILEKVIK